MFVSSGLVLLLFSLAYLVHCLLAYTRPFTAHTHTRSAHIFMCASVRVHVLSKRVGCRIKCVVLLAHEANSHTRAHSPWTTVALSLFSCDRSTLCAHVCALYRTGDVSHFSNNSYHDNNKRFLLYIFLFIYRNLGNVIGYKLFATYD